MRHGGSVTFGLVGLLMAGAVGLAQPSPRGYVDMVYVPQVDQVFLFGGQTEFLEPYTPVGESWWYDPRGDTWRQVAGESEPPPRSAAHLALHEPSGRVVMFGGGRTTGGGFEAYSETWVFDPAEDRWSQLSFADGDAPQAEIGEMFAYHAGADLFVLYGGFTLNSMRYVNPTWHFDLDAGAWTRVEPANPPPGRNYKTFAYDPRNDVLVMSGGPDTPDGRDEVWSYDPEDVVWRQHEGLPDHEPTSYARMVYDTETDALIRFGGHNEEGGTAWSVDEDLGWTLLEPAGDGPRPISRHAMAAVPGLGVLIFGGVPRGSPDFTNDLWLLNTVEMRWEKR